jgi:DNA-binding MarR family transcriptional regulator
MFRCLLFVNNAVLNHLMRMGKKRDSRTSASAPNRLAVDEPDIVGELACTNTALRRAAHRLGQLFDEALAPLNLTVTQIGLMAEIERFCAGGRGGGPTLQDLSARQAIQGSALTRALRPLVRDGLVVLRPDAADRRIRRRVLTRLGRKRLAEALVLWAAANSRVEEVLGRHSASRLRALADQVASDEFLAVYGTGDSHTDEDENKHK